MMGEQWLQLKKEAHSMKGSSGYIGAAGFEGGKGIRERHFGVGRARKRGNMTNGVGFWREFRGLAWEVF
jgi:hypothetical protein